MGKNNSITIAITYGNGEKYEAHSPDVDRTLLDALKTNLEMGYKDRKAEITNIYSVESSVITLLKAIDDFENTL